MLEAHCSLLFKHCCMLARTTQSLQLGAKADEHVAAEQNACTLASPLCSMSSMPQHGGSGFSACGRSAVRVQVLRRSYGFEADMWSLGVILYILLSGLPPFWGDSEDDIFRMVLKVWP